MSLKDSVAYWYQFVWHVKVWPSILVISRDPKDIIGMLVTANKIRV